MQILGFFDELAKLFTLFSLSLQRDTIIGQIYVFERTGKTTELERVGKQTEPLEARLLEI